MLEQVMYWFNELINNKINTIWQLLFLNWNLAFGTITIQQLLCQAKILVHCMATLALHVWLWLDTPRTTFSYLFSIGKSPPFYHFYPSIFLRTPNPPKWLHKSWILKKITCCVIKSGSEVFHLWILSNYG